MNSLKKIWKGGGIILILWEESILGKKEKNLNQSNIINKHGRRD